MEMGGAALDPDVREGLRRGWKMLMAVGVLAILVGCVAILVPAVASVATATVSNAQSRRRTNEPIVCAAKAPAIREAPATTRIQPMKIAVAFAARGRQGAGLV